MPFAVLLQPVVCLGVTFKKK